MHGSGGLRQALGVNGNRVLIAFGAYGLKTNDLIIHGISRESRKRTPMDEDINLYRFFKNNFCPMNTY